jgi:CheY-like chemotaxis protein
VDDTLPVWTAEDGRVPVLLVEDDPADALAVERILAGSIYQPLTVRTVRDARRIMQVAHPEAVVADVVLTGDESWRLLLEIRSEDASADIPLIVASSLDERRKAMHLGADEYLAKPIDPDTLLATLDRLTGRQSLTKVLLIDDEEVMHYLVRQLLPRGRYRLSIATDGRDGLDRLAEAGADVILLDLTMPGIDGFGLLDRLAEEPALNHLPVIILTSTVLSSEDRFRLERASIILSKSELSSATLLGAIERVQHADERIGAA